MCGACQPPKRKSPSRSSSGPPGACATRGAFAEAARWFVATTEHARGRWDEPGLGEWDVCALVGHTSRSLLTVEQYLDVPAERVDVETAAGYLRATRAIAAGPDVAERGRAAGAALGDDPAEPAAHALALVGETAAGTEAAVPLILAATGRTGLPDGFTIL
ncbi:hypothetical protein [Flavimobilis soli]|uniref:hypothetical protein n=1 Tax=Flavimobilis soli TaxID=442709 RepID=UPI0015E16584|nr:hypothetical protein [Flavimobilis soli]